MYVCLAAIWRHACAAYAQQLRHLRHLRQGILDRVSAIPCQGTHPMRYGIQDTVSHGPKTHAVEPNRHLRSSDTEAAKSAKHCVALRRGFNTRPRHCIQHLCSIVTDFLERLSELDILRGGPSRFRLHGPIPIRQSDRQAERHSCRSAHPDVYESKKSCKGVHL
jgi:hypothetical protein